MQKKTKVYLGLGLLFILAIIGVIIGSSLTIIGGSFTTIAPCRDYVTNSWCTSGYACSDCSLFTTAAGRYYTADCVLGSSNTGIGATGLPRTWCSSGGVVSHNGYWCYQQDLWWYNSNSVREDKKSTCAAGCTSIYTGGKESCDSPKCSGRDAKIRGVMQTNFCPSGTHCTITGSSTSSNPYTCVNDVAVCGLKGYTCDTPSSGACCSGLTCQNFQCETPTSTFCLSTNVLCNNGAANTCAGGTQTTCSSGCSNNVCNAPPACTATCTTNGKTECLTPSTFRTCAMYYPGECLKWYNEQTCANGLECNSATGKCGTPQYSGSYPVCAADGKTLCTANAQILNGEITCSGNACPSGCQNGACVIPPPVCDVTTKCITSTTFETTSSDCSKDRTNCDEGYECKNSACEKIYVPPPVDKCMGVTCDSYCDNANMYTYLSNGACNPTDGQCQFNSIVINAKECVPIPPNPTECNSTLYKTCVGGNKIVEANCVDGKYSYTQNSCDDRTFFVKIWDWIKSIFRKG